MKAILIILNIVLALNCQAQKNEKIYVQKGNCRYYYDKNLNKDIYTFADRPAEYSDQLGEFAFQKHILNNVKGALRKMSPKWIERGITPRLFCKLILDKDGTPLLFEITTNDEESEYFDELKKEMTDVVLNKSNKWIPAQCGDKKVASYINIVINIPHSYY